MIARTIYLFWPFAQMLIGLWLAYRYWQRIGTKTCVAYYFLRTVFIFTAWPLIGKIPVDIKVWAIHAQWMVDDGLFPVAEFPTAYHLGFNFILWLSYKIFHSPYSIMFVFNLFEVAAIPFMYMAIKNVFDEKTAKRTVIMFVTAPLCWICALGGQDEPIIIFFSSMLLYCLSRCRLLLGFIAAFGCFAMTKILVPIYFWGNMIVGKWKGVFLLILSMVVYWVIAVFIGINPFDFRSGVDLNQPAASLFDAGYVRGSVWYYLRFVPKVVQFAALAISWGITALMFLKTLWGNEIDLKVRLEVSCVMMALAGLEFFAFYRVCYNPYMMPFLPFIFSSIMNLSIDRRWCKRICVGLVLWLWFVSHKEDGNRWIWAMGYAVDAIIYAGYIVFGVLLFTGYRRYTNSPLDGIKVVTGTLWRRDR